MHKGRNVMKKRGGVRVARMAETGCMDGAILRQLLDDLREENRRLRLLNKRLREEKNTFKRWGEDLSLLNELNKAVVGTLDADKIVYTAYIRMRELVPHDILSIALFKQKRLWILSNVKLYGDRLEEIKASAMSVLEEVSGVSDKETYKTEVKYVAKEKCETPRGDIPPDDREFKVSNRLFFPMETGEGRIGGVQLIRHTDEPFSRHQCDIVSMIVSILTLALRNSEIHREVQEMATKDDLTGLFNKRYFLENLTKEFKTMMRYQTPVSLIMIDLDNFKLINDRFGHQAGDVILREIASLLIRSLREIDVPGRYGGDEIAIILPETVMEQAFFVARRIKRLIEEHPVRFGDESIQVTASFGISSCPNSRIRTMEDMIVAADKALYEAKREGRNRIEACEQIFSQDNAYLGPFAF